jgi:FdhD protein
LLTTDAEILRLLPPRVVFKLRCAPVSRAGNSLRIATSDPTDLASFDELRIVTGHAIELVLADEEDLQKYIRTHYGVAGDTLAVTMRTPGHDHELAMGLLFSEGLISGAQDVDRVVHCARAGDPGRWNTVDVIASPGVSLAVPDDGPTRRGTLVSSACGVCGRRSIDDLVARVGRVPLGEPVPIEAISRAIDALSGAQPIFARTGGTHCALLATFAGDVVAAFEDVGRHNAVDKLVGAMLRARRLPLSGHVLAVSGRLGFEIVQKAALAGVPIVASVSAPTSLAVELARAAGVTVAGFVRHGGLNVYACAERVLGGTLLAETASDPPSSE